MSNTIYVHGIDPSWSGMGVVCGEINNKPDLAISLKLDSVNIEKTMYILRDHLQPNVNCFNLYVIEDYPYITSSSTTILAELRGIMYAVFSALLKNINSAIIFVSPKQLKKFVTGSGKGHKSIILKDVYKRWGFDTDSDNIADAYGLWKIGCGLSTPNYDNLIKPQQEVLDKLCTKYKSILKFTKINE